MPRSAKPLAGPEALRVIAVQMILIDVAAIAAVPWVTMPLLDNPNLPL